MSGAENHSRYRLSIVNDFTVTGWLPFDGILH